MCRCTIHLLRNLWLTQLGADPSRPTLVGQPQGTNTIANQFPIGPTLADQPLQPRVCSEQAQILSENRLNECCYTAKKRAKFQTFIELEDFIAKQTLIQRILLITYKYQIEVQDMRPVIFFAILAKVPDLFCCAKIVLIGAQPQGYTAWKVKFVLNLVLTTLFLSIKWSKT